MAREAALGSESVIDDLQAFSACQCRWLLRLSDDDLRRCPEFLLEDACTIPCELNSMKPDTLRRSKPSPDLLKLCARCLGATDTLVKSPHAREKLGCVAQLRERVREPLVDLLDEACGDEVARVDEGSAVLGFR